MLKTGANRQNAIYSSSRYNPNGRRWLSLLAMACLALLAAASLPSSGAAAAAASPPLEPAAPAQPFPTDALAAYESAKGATKEKRAGMKVMDCGQRCESYEIQVFKAHWRRRHPNMHFIDFLRDLVVFSAYYPELRDFKPLVDRAVQSYEMCRYITCSTDYMG